jgi:hypothetical protein
MKVTILLAAALVLISSCNEKPKIVDQQDLDRQKAARQKPVLAQRAAATAAAIELATPKDSVLCKNSASELVFFNLDREGGSALYGHLESFGDNQYVPVLGEYSVEVPNDEGFKEVGFTYQLVLEEGKKLFFAESESKVHDSQIYVEGTRLEYRANVEVNLETGAGTLFTAKAYQVLDASEKYQDQYVRVLKSQKLSECRLVTAEQVPPALEE